MPTKKNNEKVKPKINVESVEQHLTPDIHEIESQGPQEEQSPVSIMSQSEQNSHIDEV